MCGRFIDPNLRGTEFELSEIKIQPFKRRYNVKPTDPALIVSGEPLSAAWARWGLIPAWFKGVDPKDWKAATFNARIEEAKDKPTYRSAWRYGRCLIPIGGFYEWTGPKGAKQPHFIQSAGNAETLWLAGLVSPWHDLLTCTIMTRAANEGMLGLHDRMPVILDPEEREAWLAGSEDLTLGAGVALRHHSVQRFGLHDDGPELIEEIDC